MGIWGTGIDCFERVSKCFMSHDCLHTGIYVRMCYLRFYPLPTCLSEFNEHSLYLNISALNEVKKRPAKMPWPLACIGSGGPAFMIVIVIVRGRTTSRRVKLIILLCFISHSGLGDDSTATKAISRCPHRFAVQQSKVDSTLSAGKPGRLASAITITVHITQQI